MFANRVCVCLLISELGIVRKFSSVPIARCVPLSLSLLGPATRSSIIWITDTLCHCTRYH